MKSESGSAICLYNDIAAIAANLDCLALSGNDDVYRSPTPRACEGEQW